MSVAEDHYEAFATAAEDPYLGALLGTIDEPGGTSTANRAGRLTLAWWDEHGNGPTCAELIEAVFEIDDWDAAIEDPGRTLFERHEQRDQEAETDTSTNSANNSPYCLKPRPWKAEK